MGIDRSDSAPIDNAERYSLVPENFPRPRVIGAVPGAQPKFFSVQYQGRYNLPACTPQDLFVRWDICEDLAQRFASQSIKSKAGKRTHMTESAILIQYLVRLLKTGWCSEEECVWVMRQAAQIIEWPFPSLEIQTANPTYESLVQLLQTMNESNNSTSGENNDP